jgi:transposase
MTIESINIEKTLQKARDMLADPKEKTSPGLRAVFEVLLLLITLLVNRLKLNSSNSSKPPSSDPNRQKDKTKNKNGRKPGGQKGHEGKTIELVENPDHIESIPVDRTDLPDGKYQTVGYERRQVVDIVLTATVTEYRAEILENEKGKRFTASFPEGVTRTVQYGNKLKSHAIYLSQYQLMPYNRICEYFESQFGIRLSGGSIYNFNEDAYNNLGDFAEIVKDKLRNAPVCNADETGINIDAKRMWLHCASNTLWTFFYPHEKRGKEAMDEMNIFPGFKGVLCHDHWKPYFKYNCLHSLCNAHHLRELERAFEQDGQKWAREMQDFLLRAKKLVEDFGGHLSDDMICALKAEYAGILENAQLECSAPECIENGKKKRGRIKRSKSRNLLERFMNYQQEVLRFMENPDVPFTNNQGENDLRMTKVQQKISGCFRSKKGAQIFCLVRSYISTCKKHKINADEALTLLLDGKLPEFLIT